MTAPLQAWIFTERPWSRLHIYYCGPISGKMLLVIIDSHSKWLEVHIASMATSKITIEHLGITFSTHCIPDTIVSDNASCFTSNEFIHFCKMNGIKHITSAPYHPSTNGMAERAVQTVKEGLKRLTCGTLETRLYIFIFTYRITPQTTTHTSLAEQLLKRKPKSTLDLIRPDHTSTVYVKQQEQKQYHDIHSKQCEFSIGDNVFALIHARNSQTWLPATITAITGPLSFVVQLDDGRTQRCHINQLRARHSNAPQTEINIPGSVFVPTIPDTVTRASSETTSVSPVRNR